MDIVEVTRRYTEAEVPYQREVAELTERFSEIGDQEVRNAKIHLALSPDVKDAFEAARVDFAIAKAEQEERWISAHEDLAIPRNPTLS